MRNSFKVCLGIATCWVLTSNFARADYVSALNSIAAGNKISYWNLNESSGTTAADSWTTGTIDGTNTGTYSGTGITVGAAGPSGVSFPGFSASNKAASFAGTSATQLLSMNPDDFLGVEELTLLMFVKIDPSLTSNDRFLGGIHATTGMSRYAFSLISRSNAMRGGVRVWGDDEAMELGGLFDTSPAVTGAFRDNVWHFVALTMENDDVSGDKLVKMFIDGVPQTLNSTTITGADGDGLAPRVTTDTTGALSFGNDLGDTARFLRGSLDEIAFINGALSASQISQLWTAATTVAIPEPGPFVLLSALGGLSGLVALWQRRAMKQ